MPDRFAAAAEKFQKQQPTDRFAKAAASYNADPLKPVDDFLKEGFDTAVGDVSGMAKMGWKALSDPSGAGEEMYQGYKQGTDREFAATKQAWKEHNPLGVVSHGMSWMVPFVGPQTQDIAKDATTGHLGRAAVRTGELFLGGKALEAQPEVGAALQSHVNSLESGYDAFVKQDPKVAAAKAFSPPPNDTGFHDHAEESLAQIKEHNSGHEIRTNEQHIKAAQKTEKALGDRFKKWLIAGARNGAVVMGDDIVSAYQNAMPIEPMARKAMQSHLDALRQEYAGKQIPVTVANKIRSELTQELDSYYSQNPGTRHAHVGSSDQIGMTKARHDAIAEGVNRALDPSGAPGGPKDIQRARAGIIDLVDLGKRRRNMDLASKPISKKAAVMTAIPNVIKSVTGGGGPGAFAKAADLSNPETLWGGQVGPWVHKAYKATGKPKMQFRDPPPVTWNPARALPPATPRLGPWVTPSSGPGSFPKPPGQQGWPGPYMGHGMSPSVGNRLLGPATQVQQPGFSVMDAHPITDITNSGDTGAYSKGHLGYVPEHYQAGQVPASESLPSPTTSKPLGKGKLSPAQGKANLAQQRLQTKLGKRSLATAEKMDKNDLLSHAQDFAKLNLHHKPDVLSHEIMRRYSVPFIKAQQIIKQARATALNPPV